MPKIKFLIVDDELVDRTYYQRVLTQFFDIPYDMLEANSALHALEILQSNSMDCILLDYMLPDMNGIELLKRIKEIPGLYTPVIMLTRQGNETIAVQAMKSGAVDYISKDKMEPEQFVKLIKDIIRNYQLKIIINEQTKNLKNYPYYDSLTGLINRHTFEEMAAHAISDSKHFNYSLMLFLIDLDNFMNINDSFGHLAGDEILIEISIRLRQILPNDGIIARLRNDEFAVLLTGLEKEINVDSVANMILEKISEPYQLITDITYVSACIGVSCYSEKIQGVTELLKNADTALAHAKVAGRGKFHLL